jgi:osmoprotectant transport system permease protein
MSGPRNSVLFALVLAANAACLFSGFLSQAPNRLVTGRPLFLWHAIGVPSLFIVAIASVVLLVVSFLRPSKTTLGATLAIAALLLLLLCLAAGQGADTLMAGNRPATRISLGLAFWIANFCLVMIVLDALQRLRASPGLRVMAVAAVALPLAAMILAGTLDQLSLMREYAARRDIFGTELLRHVWLVLASAGAALVIGVPLGLLAARKPNVSPALFGTLNLLQTIPSVALFGLLIVPLSALASAMPVLASWGVGGIGPAPAIVALILYSLLPIVRNTHAAITRVDPAIIDAAQGMGLTPTQIFWRIELPLGMPTVMAGLRITLVQTIGLAAVAALIGAGGLGTFVFQGIGEYATDLVLLGAIPIILLALAADFTLNLIVLSLGGRETP